MLKEMEPDIKPEEIKKILLQSTSTTIEGVSMLDAEKACKILSE